MLKDLNRDLERLATDKERYEREIQRARETIAKAEQDIEDNLKAQEEMAARIKAQEDVIKSVQKRLNDL
jgi:DNA-binding transcriptional regulator GbsR (MarR family)